jgi:hypothetical protein
MTLADIATFACQTTGDISSDAYDYAKRAIRLKYATLYDAHSWREAQRVVDGTLLDPTLAACFFASPTPRRSFESELRRANYTRLTQSGTRLIERFAAPRFNLPGTPGFIK